MHRLAPIVFVGIMVVTTSILCLANGENSLDMEVYRAEDIVLGRMIGKIENESAEYKIGVEKVLKGKRSKGEKILVYCEPWKQCPEQNEKRIFFIGGAAFNDGTNSYYYIYKFYPLDKEAEIASLLKEQSEIANKGSAEENSLKEFVERFCVTLELNNLEDFKKITKSLVMDGEKVDSDTMAKIFSEIKQAHSLYNYRPVFLKNLKAQRYPIYKGFFALGGHDYGYVYIGLKRESKSWYIASIDHCS